MVETSLMVHDYPEPPETKEKCFIFKCEFEVEVKVWAKDYETAKEYCNLKDCDEYEIKTMPEDIIDYEVEN